MRGRGGRVVRGALAALVLSGCAARGPVGPVVSPTGVVFEGGSPPRETRDSQTATLYLRTGFSERALDLALEGISADSTNPIHYFLAGVASARLQRYADASVMFTNAERLYPAYVLETELEREAAWGQAFNEGLAAYEAGDVDGTISLWAQAAGLFDLRPEAHRNLGALLTSESRYPEAVDVYLRALAGLAREPLSRVLTDEEAAARATAHTSIEEELAPILLLTGRFADAEPMLRRRVSREPDNAELRAQLATALTGQGREAEAREVYAQLLSEGGLQAAELFNLGIGLFRSGEYEQAAEAFQRLIALQPDSRDAWFNYANSLFAAQAWGALVEAGPQLVEVDPLGENTLLIIARARLESGDRDGALESLRGVEQLPVFVESLRMQRSGVATTVVGSFTGNVAAEGAPIMLLFTFYGDDGQLLGTQTLTSAAPSPEERRDFEVRFEGVASAYRYEALYVGMEPDPTPTDSTSSPPA